MKELFRSLRAPYPFYYSFQRFVCIAIASGLFVFLFLQIFQPFGTYGFQHPHKTVILMGYGLVTLIVMTIWFVVFPLLFRYQFEENRWTVGKQIGLLISMVVTLGSLCYFYQISVLNYSFSWRNWIHFIWLSLSIGFFPIIFITAFDYYLKMNRFALPPTPVNIKSTATHKNQIFVLVDEHQRDKVAFNLSELLFIRSEENYVEVFLRKGKIDFEKHLLRLSLKTAESVLQAANIIRCHRSYLINIENCSSIKGNSQGYRLRFEGVPSEVPVARGKSNEIKEMVLGR